MSKPYTRLDKNAAAVLLVDHQTGLLSLVRDIDPDKFKNNVLALADIAAYFKLPTILTTSFEDGPNGPLVPELQEQFLWCTDAECEARIHDKKRRKAIAQELADVVNYALLLADRMDLDLPTEIRKKIRINARKYPVRKSKGLAKKYTEL